MRTQQTITAYNPSCAACNAAVDTFKTDIAFCTEHAAEYFELTNPGHIENIAGEQRAENRDDIQFTQQEVDDIIAQRFANADNTAAEYMAEFEAFNELYLEMNKDDKWTTKAKAVRLSALGLPPNIIKAVGTTATPYNQASTGQPVAREHFDDLRIITRVIQNTRP